MFCMVLDNCNIWNGDSPTFSGKLPQNSVFFFQKCYYLIWVKIMLNKNVCKTWSALPSQILYLGKYYFMSYGSKCSRPVTYRTFENPVFWEGRQIWTWLCAAVIQKYESHLVFWNGRSQEHPYMPKVFQNEESAICREWVEVISWFPVLLSYIHRGHKFIQAIKVIVVRPACVCLKYFKEMTQQCLN